MLKQKLSFGLFFLLLILILQLTPALALTGNYSMSDLLGQVGGTGEAIFNQGGALNTAISNKGFQYPADVLVETAFNHVYVADQKKGRVLVYDINAGTKQLIDRLPDAVLCQPNLTTVNAGMSQNTCGPSGLAFDSVNDRLFVLDSIYHRVLVFNTLDGVTSGEAPVNVIGAANFTTLNAGTGSTSFFDPSDIAYSTGNSTLYVADMANNRIQVFDLSGGITNGMAAAKSLCSTSPALQGTGLATQNTCQPTALHLQGNNLFVADNLNRVLVFDVSTVVNAEAAINVLGQSNFTSSAAAIPPTQNGVYLPWGLAYDTVRNYLFVADSANARVLVFNVADGITDNEPAIAVLGQALFTTSTITISQSGMGRPLGLSYETTNNFLYVADSDLHRVQVYDLAVISNGENAANSLGQLDGSNNPIYNQWGPNNTFFAVDGKGFRFSSPMMSDYGGILVEPVAHRLFVSDTVNNRVLVFNLNTDNTLIDRTADFVLGQNDLTSQVLGPTGAGKMYSPAGLAYDTTNNRLFVADQGYNRVMVFNLADGITNGEAAVNVLGQINFTNTGQAITDIALDSPAGLAYDSTGNRLFVADTDNNRIMVFHVGTIGNGEPAVNVLGQFNFTLATPGTPPTQGKMYKPMGLAYDSTGSRLFVADKVNYRVLVFDARTSGSAGTDLCSNATVTTGLSDGMNASCVLGQANFTALSNARGQGVLLYPLGVAYDSQASSLYVADTANHRVIAFDVAAITNGENAVAMFGHDGYTDTEEPLANGSLASPVAIDFDPTLRRLYVTDQGYNRIGIFDTIRVTTTTQPSGTMGTTYSQTLASTNSQHNVSWATAPAAVLPTGLSLSAAGVISGTPTATGTYTFGVRATDGGLSYVNYSDDQTLSITIASTGASTPSIPKIAAQATVQVNLGEHRNQAFLRIVNQLLKDERMIKDRVTLGDLMRSRAGGSNQFSTITEIQDHPGFRATLLQLVTDNPELRALLRGQSSDHLILEVWTKGDRNTPLATVPLSTNLFGEATVTLPTLAGNTSYDFTIRKPFGLRQTLESIPLQGSMDLHFKSPLRVGDVDGDGKINLNDFQFFIDRYKEKNLEYDLNEDGVFDLNDFSDFLKGWNEGP